MEFQMVGPLKQQMRNMITILILFALTSCQQLEITEAPKVAPKAIDTTVIARADTTKTKADTVAKRYPIGFTVTIKDWE